MTATGGDGSADTVPAATELAARARRILEDAWRAPGYTAPNAATYPWQWLWDSCFHAVVWAHVGDERGRLELEHALAGQADDGFVPHITYWSESPHASFWGRPAHSSITQPPMFGHAAAELARRGLLLDDHLLERCRAGLWHLLRDRARTPGGLVTLVHPWESGADDGPRWDHWCPGGFDLPTWYDVKGELVAAIERNPSGSPERNPAFEVGAAGFNALVAFNARELAPLVADDELAAEADALARSLDRCWDGDLETWVDDGPSRATSGRVRTLDALLPVLCTDDPARARRVLARAVDDGAYGGACGPAGVHRDEPVYAPDTYWRGPAWPQLTYLLWVGAGRAGCAAERAALSAMARRGAVRSGFAEHWHPDTGAPGGAAPQSWAALAAVMDSV